MGKEDTVIKVMVLAKTHGIIVSIPYKVSGSSKHRGWKTQKPRIEPNTTGERNTNVINV